MSCIVFLTKLNSFRLRLRNSMQGLKWIWRVLRLLTNKENERKFSLLWSVITDLDSDGSLICSLRSFLCQRNPILYISCILGFPFLFLWLEKGHGPAMVPQLDEAADWVWTFHLKSCWILVHLQQTGLRLGKAFVSLLMDIIWFRISSNGV